MRLIDGLAYVGVAQQQRDGEVGFLTRDGRADGRSEGAATEHDHLLCALQHGLLLIPLPSTLQSSGVGRAAAHW